MKKTFLLVLILFVIYNFSSAQDFWHEVGGTGANALNAPNEIISICTDPSGNVYAAYGDNGIYVGYSYVSEWNGATWTRLPGIFSGGVDYLCTDNYGNLYATCGLLYFNGGYVDSGNLYVAKWNGNSWSALGNLGPSNKGSLDICSAPSGDLYAALNYSSEDTSLVFKWNGAQWVELTQNWNVNITFINSMCADNAGNLYVASNNPGNYIVEKWDGSTWTQTGTGLSGLNANGDIFGLCADKQGNIYAGGLFDLPDGGGSYVAKWNGASWNEVGTGNNPMPIGIGNFVWSLCADDTGNIYAGCGGVVTKWDGRQWTALDTAQTPYGSFFSMCTDHHGNLYGAGGFYNMTQPDSGYYYVAEYGPAQSNDLYVFLSATDANCTAPGSVASTVYGGTAPYSYRWNNNQTAANLNSAGSGKYSVTVTDANSRQATGQIQVDSACLSFVSGIAFLDANGNCVYDSGDIPLRNEPLAVTSLQGAYFYGMTDDNGNFELAVSGTGTFTVSETTPFSSYCTCVRLTSCGGNFTISQAGDTLTGINVAGTTSAFDLTMFLAWTAANPGFIKQYMILPYNRSPLPFNGQATVIFTYDSNLIYQNSLPPYPTVDTVNHTLTWALDGASLPDPTFQWYTDRLVSNFMVPSSLSLNYQLQNQFEIQPFAGDCYLANNLMQTSQAVTGSFDPNSKTVSPAGQLSASDSILTYTISFENTGTDSTHFVRVVDTISPYLDPASVVNIATSSMYSSFNVSGTGILTWTFNPLQLPPASVDSVNSKGFILFSIKRKAGAPPLTSISNSASIYFDYNTAIQTNTVIDTTASLSGIRTLNSNNISLEAFPNPFNDVTHITVSGINQKFDFELYDIIGRTQMRLPSLQTYQFDLHRQQLSTGVYLYHIIVAGEVAGYGKLVIE